ncbi:Cytochrome c553 [Leminorella richardii]|uniref:Cytochrome c553 n=1 Tax=Leminorella richardii TaxID=158841 RepID=A0A2X4ULN0_9GAMM|nr:c-type cytochrome [Leminorella richardii]SQI40806.1 Cytochrome c553 [Leminorella richardii]
MLKAGIATAVVLFCLGAPAHGQEIKGFYQKNCASCHGRNGEKTALNKARKLTTLDEAQITEALKTRRDGKVKGAGNQVKKRLSDEDIHQLSEYIQTINPR